jgi:transposase
LKNSSWKFSLNGAARFVIFDYDLSRSSIVVNEKLSGYKGLLQTDGYSGCNALPQSTDIVNLGCFAHCRHYFFKAEQVAGKKCSLLASRVLKYIRDLYRIEAKIKTHSPQERAAQRLARSKPILDEFYSWLNKHKETILLKSKLGQAFTYAISQWPSLINTVEHGEAHLDNNLIENLIRPFAVGRRNWLFIGNERGD